jgi:hypothetical protein
MFRKILLAAAAATAGLTALPATASADHGRDGYYGRGGYDRGYDERRYDRRGYGERRYDRRGYDGRRSDRGYAAYGYDGYDDYGYRDGRRYRRCGSGTGGAIVGGAAGALVGRNIARDGRRYSRRGGSGTTGAIIGGAVGALIGREVGRSC